MSTGAAGKANGTGRKPELDLSSYSPSIFEAKMKKAAEDQAARKVKDEADAAEKKAKAIAAKKQLDKENKQRSLRLQGNHQLSILDTLKRENEKKRQASKPQSRMAMMSTSKEAEPQTKAEPTKNKVNKSKTSSTSHASKSPRKDKSNTTTQAKSLKAELDSDSPEATYVPGETAFPPVPASASGDVLNHDVEPLASEHMNLQDMETTAQRGADSKETENTTTSSDSNTTTSRNETKPATWESSKVASANIPTAASSAANPSSYHIDTEVECAQREEICLGFKCLRKWQQTDVWKLVQKRCKVKLNDDDEFDLADMPYGDLVYVVVRIRGHLENNANEDQADDSEETRVNTTHSETGRANDEPGNDDNEQDASQHDTESTGQTEQHSEKLRPSLLENDLNEHGKRSRVDDDIDDQTTSELSGVHKRKRACSLYSSFEPREKSAHVALRSVSVDGSAMSSSSQESVTVNSVIVNTVFVPMVNGDMIPFGAEGDASQKYQHQNDQRHADLMADFKHQGAGKTIQKRRASSEPLPESISRAKKPKQTHEERALLDEANLATGESMAEAKILKSEEVMDTPEVASFVGDESLHTIGHATSASHFNGAAADEDASVTETQSATKEGANSKNDEGNMSSSNSSKNDSNDEKSMQKGTTKVSKTDSAIASTSPPTHEQVAHQDATQIDDKTSQATDNEPAESSTGKIATQTTNQQPAAQNGKTKSALKTQDGQKSTKTKASDAPKSTTTSGSATRTGTQQKAVHKSKKQDAQDEVTKAVKKTANNSDKTNTDDKAKIAKKTEPLPQKKSKATNDVHDNTNKQKSSEAKTSSAKPASSAAGTENASGRVTGTAHFVSTPKDQIKRTAKPTQREQSSTQGQQTAVKKALAEKTNTHRLPAQSEPKKTAAYSSKKQSETAGEQTTPQKSGGGKKRRRSEDDGVEAAEKTTKASSASSGNSKKRNRDDENDGDAESTNKPAKKQRNIPPPIPAPQQLGHDANAAPRGGRASRSKALAAEKAAALPRGPEPEREFKPFHLSGVGDSDDDESEDEVQPPKKKTKTEAAAPTREDKEKAEETSADDAQNDVANQTSSDTGDTSDVQTAPTPAPAPTTAADPDRPRGVARPTNPKKKKATATARGTPNMRSRFVYE